MNTRTKFVEWYFTHFHTMQMFQRMLETVEGSPWHREANVGVHTDMVLSEYLTTAPREWDHLVLSGAFACAFHDVGKPVAMVVKESAERGEYKSFAGHEQPSARMWEDFACSEWGLMAHLGLVHSDIYSVGWMIEHHLPYDLRKPNKLHNLRETMNQMQLRDIFPAVLLADQRGRISDPSHQKVKEVQSWIVNTLLI